MSNFTNLSETTVENSADYLQQFSEQTQPDRLAQRLFDLLERLVDWSSLKTINFLETSYTAFAFLDQQMQQHLQSLFSLVSFVTYY